MLDRRKDMVAIPEWDIFPAEVKKPKTVGIDLVWKAIDVIRSTIPGEVNPDTPHFVHIYEEDGKPAFKLSLLTNDQVIHDFTYSVAEQKTTYMRLNSCVRAVLSTSFKEKGDGLESQPYKADFRIEDGNKSLDYSAEGEQSQALKSYAEKCLRAMHKSG
jgi:hypothetical protein